MESQIAQLWKTLQWGFGLCFIGFTFLLGWLLMVIKKMSDKASFDWIENTFTKQINARFKDITMKFDVLNGTMGKIEKALCGDFEQRGIIQGVEDTKKEISEMKEHCKSIQEDKKKNE